MPLLRINILFKQIFYTFLKFIYQKFILNRFVVFFLALLLSFFINALTVEAMTPNQNFVNDEMLSILYFMQAVAYIDMVNHTLCGPFQIPKFMLSDETLRYIAAHAQSAAHFKSLMDGHLNIFLSAYPDVLALIQKTSDVSAAAATAVASSQTNSIPNYVSNAAMSIVDFFQLNQMTTTQTILLGSSIGLLAGVVVVCFCVVYYPSVVDSFLNLFGNSEIPLPEEAKVPESKIDE